MIEHIYKLNITPTGKPKTIHVSQYDGNSRALKFELYNDYDTYSIPSGTTVKMTGTKPSGKGFEVVGSFSENVVTIVVTDQMTVEPGSVLCELVLTNGSKRLGTQNILMEVEKAGLSTGTVISSDTFDSIIKDKVQESAEKGLIKLTVDTELDHTSDAPVSNKEISNNVANALKGYVYGASVTATDISPIKHDLKVRVHGKNLIPFPYKNETATVLGGTFTQQADGGFLLSGTPAGYSEIIIYEGEPITKNGKVTLSGIGTYTNITIVLAIYDSYGNILAEKSIYADSPYRTVNLDDYPEAKKWLILLKRRSDNVVMSGVVYPQLEKGETATTYEKWLNTSNVTVIADSTTYTPLTNGEVKGISSSVLFGGISVNDSNYTLECEYIRDTNEVIKTLVNAIITLGGSV